MKKTILTYFRNIFILVLFIFSSTQSNATHIIGGDITYTCLGSNQYEVTLTIFKDCAGIGLNDSAYISFGRISKCRIS